MGLKSGEFVTYKKVTKKFEERRRSRYGSCVIKDFWFNEDDTVGLELYCSFKYDRFPDAGELMDVAAPALFRADYEEMKDEGLPAGCEGFCGFCIMTIDLVFTEVA